jgi:cell shape-determining protein MreC
LRKSNAILVPLSDVLKQFIVRDAKQDGSELFDSISLGLSIHTSATIDSFLNEPYWRLERFCEKLNRYLEEQRKAREKQEKSQQSKMETSKYMREAKRSMPSLKVK